MSTSEFFLKFNPVKGLRVPIKLGLVTILMFALVLFLLTQLVTSLNKDIEFRALELQGTRYIPSLYKIISHTQVTRGLTNSKLNGTSGLDDRIFTNRESALEGYQELLANIAQFGDLNNLRTMVMSAQSEFEALNRRAFNADGATLFQQYTDLIADLRQLIIHVGDFSNLTLDPELDTFYLMDYLIFKAHVTAEANGVLRGRGSGIIAANNYSSTALIPFARILGGANGEALIKSLQSAAEANSSLEVELRPLIRDLEQAQQVFGEQVIRIVERNSSTVSAADYFSMGTSAISVIYDGVGQTNAILQRLLMERIAQMETARVVRLSISLAVLLIAGYVLTATIVSIVVSLRRTVSALNRVAAGDLTTELAAVTNDEFAELARAMNQTQDILRNNIATERAQAEETLRIKTALDVTDLPVMLADNDMNIIYMNEAASQLMVGRAAELKTVLPKFDPHELVGTNVDVFHKKPEHQRSMISALTKRHKSRIKVAGLVFNLTATPLMNADQVRSGTVIEWEDITDELKEMEEFQRVANENARIRQALDNISTNTMIADDQRNIVYLNKSVISMLKHREAEFKELFPDFDIDNLIGRSIDIFHKNPKHQEVLLESLKSSYKTQIKVSGLSFRLAASPVFNEKGERIGSVLEWDDRTEQVAIENEIDALITSAAHGDLSKRIAVNSADKFLSMLGTGLNQLVEISEGVVNDTARVFSALSHGDLTETIKQDYEGAFGELKNDANATVTKLTQIITEIREAAGTVSAGADELAQGNADLSQRTEEQASSLEETASSMEQMTSAVKSSADNAMQANDIAKETESLATSGGSVVQNAVSAMNEINESSKHIADIIGVIDEIAFQTNLLALNAAVEAARAGEQGRGFAVVASEVRNLAQRSAGAAKEIKDLIRDSVDKVNTGSDLVNRSGETLEEIVGSVRKVSTMVNGISGSAHEQSSGIDQVNKAVSQMDEMTQQNAALVEEATAAGETMAEQARKLMRQMAFFTLNHDVAATGTEDVTPAVNSNDQQHQPSAGTSFMPVQQGNAAPQGGKEVNDADDEWEEF